MKKLLLAFMLPLVAVAQESNPDSYVFIPDLDITYIGNSFIDYRDGNFDY